MDRYPIIVLVFATTFCSIVFSTSYAFAKTDPTDSESATEVYERFKYFGRIGQFGKLHKMIEPVSRDRMIENVRTITIAHAIIQDPRYVFLIKEIPKKKLFYIMMQNANFNTFDSWVKSEVRAGNKATLIVSTPQNSPFVTPGARIDQKVSMIFQDGRWLIVAGLVDIHSP